MLYKVDSFLIEKIAQPLTGFALETLQLTKIRFAKAVYLFGNIIKMGFFLYSPITQPTMFFIDVIWGTLVPSIFVYCAIKKAEKRFSAQDNVEDFSLFLCRNYLFLVNVIFVFWLFFSRSLLLVAGDIFGVSMQLVILVLCCKEPTVKQRKKVTTTYEDMVLKVRYTAPS